MAECTTRSGTGATAHSETLRSFSEQAIEAGREFNDKAGAGNKNLKDQASGLANEAKEMAGQGTETIKQAVSHKKDAGAAYVDSLAEAIRCAGREFDSDFPIVGKYIRNAASQVESVACSIRMGGLNDLVLDAQSFARRQPTASLGIAALAGFAFVRFLNSSADAPADLSVHRGGRQAQTSQTGYRDGFSK